jgi:predicted Zn-dependent peptidase
VFREFYKERDVVMEEYRMRIESSPQGQLMQAFLATAFAAHPYRQMGAGWPSDIRNLRREDAWKFYRTYYVPGNLTIGIVGDVDPAQARRLAEKYFAALPQRELPPLLHTEEPPQRGPRQAQVQSPSQPFLFIGYKRPDLYHKDDPVFDVLAGVLASGRTGLLYREMVRDRKISLVASAAGSYPGSRYPNLFLFFLAPSLGHAVEENEQVFYELLERFRNETVDAETLERVKTKTRAGLIRQLDSNRGLASLLTTYHAIYGDWRKLFTSIQDIEKVTAGDVQRVARQYFVPESRTTAFTYQPRKEGEK